jgi:hypothetical protein
MDGAIVRQHLPRWLALAAYFSLVEASASAAILDDFEAPQASWKAGDADAQIGMFADEPDQLA